MKKLPVCAVCASTGFLCINCSDKMESGEISEFEVEISKELVRMEEEGHTELKDASFVKVIDFGKIVLFFVGQGDRPKFLKGVVQAIQEIFDIDRIQVIEFSTNINRLVENLVYPAKLLGVNQIYLPMGTVEYKARVTKGDEENLPLHIEDLEEIIEELTGKTTKIVFDG